MTNQINTPASREAAADYIRRVCRRREAEDRRRTAFVQRMLCGSALFFGWACVLSLLVGGAG